MDLQQERFLEEHLLQLGQHELMLEERVKLLRVLILEAYQAHEDVTGAAYENQRDTAKRELEALGVAIRHIEAKLYGFRNRKRR
jgi:hypothetical protein